MTSVDPYTFFPAYAVFIGANMGMAAYIHFRSLPRHIYKWFKILRKVLIVTLVASATCSIIGSAPMWDNSEIGKTAIYLLLASYVLILILFPTSFKLEADEEMANKNLKDQENDSRNNKDGW